MAREKKTRNKAAEKAVKERIGKTHLKSIKILGSEKDDEKTSVYLLRIVGADNYLFRINCVTTADGGFSLSGLIPVNNPAQFGQYSVYNPKTASAEVLRPTEKEKKFTGYGK